MAWQRVEEATRPVKGDILSPILGDPEGPELPGSVLSWVMPAKFKVYTPQAATEYDIDWQYSIEDQNGALALYQSPDLRHITYGPAGWLRIEETLILGE